MEEEYRIAADIKKTVSATDPLKCKSRLDTIYKEYCLCFKKLEKIRIFSNPFTYKSSIPYWPLLLYIIMNRVKGAV
jgi:hypothetical protein